MDLYYLTYGKFIGYIDSTAAGRLATHALVLGTSWAILSQLKHALSILQ